MGFRRCKYCGKKGVYSEYTKPRKGIRRKLTETCKYCRKRWSV